MGLRGFSFAAMMCAAAAAQASDLPRQGRAQAEPFTLLEPVDYVRVCDQYGAGFWFIPGTDTCLRVGGRVRGEVLHNNLGARPDGWLLAPDPTFDSRFREGLLFRSRASVRLDARTQSEFGLLRGYIDMEARLISKRDGVHGADDNPLRLNKAYVQVGGFTFGRARSQFDYFTGATMGAVKRNWSDRDTFSAAYTAQSGQGTAFTLALEDRTARDSGVYVGKSGLNGVAANRYPDLVAALRTDQYWGSFQVAGALSEVRSRDADVDSTVGYAAMAGLMLAVPQLGASDALALQVQWAQGAMDYMGIDNVYNAALSAGKTKLTQGVSVSGGFTHYFNAQWRSDLDGSYAVVHVPQGAPQDSYSRVAVDFDVVYEPVRGFELGVDVGAARAFIENEKDFNEVSALMRVQRVF
ncbi:porin [Polycladidibacter hongkongensis]|uniref:porin n=1 Tax=Polycladidibacter hongkongensis TaxID=1647556 RepID=UPI0008354940|nr:porin [Pseudovibrio hongkongensis]